MRQLQRSPQLLAVAGCFCFGLSPEARAWCVCALAADLDRATTGNTQFDGRKEMFVFALPGELFALAERTPAFAPLFQLPPTRRSIFALASSHPSYPAAQLPPNLANEAGDVFVLAMTG